MSDIYIGGSLLTFRLAFAYRAFVCLYLIISYELFSPGIIFKIFIQLLETRLPVELQQKQNYCTFSKLI
jgi:hypothetical protein